MTDDADVAARLLHVLRTASATPGLDYARPPEPLTGGFWAELLAFTLADPPPGWPAALVARLMPDAQLARKETIVQAAVAAAGFPTPAVRASGGPDSGLGRAFMVMDRAPGAPLISGLNGVATMVSGIGLLRRIPEVLAASMAALHGLDPRLVRDQLDPSGALPVTVPALLQELQGSAADYHRGDLVVAGKWLTAHRPAPAPEVICHGDLHPFNLLVDQDRISVLDWSAALLAPRAHDVAFTALLLARPPVEVPATLRPLVRWVGALLARRFISHYQLHSGVVIDPAELRWYQGVACLRALVEVAGWVQQGIVAERAGHPWLTTGPAIAARLSALTGTTVQSR